MILTFNKQQLSELFNRNHFESLLNRIFLPQKSENARPYSSNSCFNFSFTCFSKVLVWLYMSQLELKSFFFKYYIDSVTQTCLITAAIQLHSKAHVSVKTLGTYSEKSCHKCFSEVVIPYVFGITVACECLN